MRRFLRSFRVTVNPCSFYGHRYSVRAYPPACIFCGRTITRPW